MQIREAIKYDVRTSIQTLLDTMKNLRHADNVAYPKPGELRRMCARFDQRRLDEIRKRIKRGGYNVKV
jgi:hypothetical protein